MYYHIETREERFWGTAISRVAPPSSILALFRQLAKQNWLYEKNKKSKYDKCSRKFCQAEKSQF